MTALTRRHFAAPKNIDDPAISAWRRAVEIRRSWLDHGLATEPADRHRTEESLTRVYARLGRSRPTFVWVDSPPAAQPLVTTVPNHEDLHRWVYGSPPGRKRPLASDLVAALSQFRGALNAAVERPGFDPPSPKRKKEEKWPVLAPADALRAGVPFLEALHQGVHDALRATLADAFYLRVRAALGEPTSLPVCWYGQQEAYWIAYYDACQRLGLAHYRGEVAEQYDDWATLARSSGWWWPDEELCVVAECPAVVHATARPGAWHEERQLSHIGYRDGWTVHSGSGPV